MTIVESASNAVRPWFSLDAITDGDDSYYRLPQQSIDVCLMCKHCAEHCEHCGDWNTQRRGRKRAEIDMELLKEMMKLKRRNSEMCASLGINERTLQRAKKALT